MKLTIIDKYIARELLAAFLSVIFVLLIIVLSTEVVHLLSWVTQGIIPISALLSYLTNSLFEFSLVLIPLSLLMGILLAFGRLYHDSEMSAIMSAGIGPMQWYRPLMLITIPTTVILLILLLYARPLITHQRELITAEIKSQTEVDRLMVGQFNRASKGDSVLFLESQDKQKNMLNNVFFQHRDEQGNHVDLAASTSNYYDSNGRQYIMMHDGTHYIGNAGEKKFTIIQYKDYGVFVDKKQVAVHRSEKSKMPAELLASDKPADQAELQWRLTLPLATLIVAFMALPLSHTSPRSGRYSKLGISLIIYLVYSNLLSVANTWIIQEKVPLWVGTWWVHLLAAIVTLFLLKYYGYLSGLKPNRGAVAGGTGGT